MCPLSCSSLGLLFQCPRDVLMFMLSFLPHSAQAARQLPSSLPACQGSISDTSFLVLENINFFSQGPHCRKGLIYINLHSVWQGPGGDWAEDHGDSHPSSKWQPLPRAPHGDTAAAAPPAQLDGPPRGTHTGQQVIHKRLLQHPVLWCLNNQTSAGENEKNKFNSFLVIHSTLVIFQLLSVCRGLSMFQWQHVNPHCSDSSQLLINFIFLVPIPGMFFML